MCSVIYSHSERYCMLMHVPRVCKFKVASLLVLVNLISVIANNSLGHASTVHDIQFSQPQVHQYVRLCYPRARYQLGSMQHVSTNILGASKPINTMFSIIQISW